MNQEQETIGLCVATEAIDDIANHLIFHMRKVKQFHDEAELIFDTSAHKDLFLVRLLDFVHEAGDKALNGVRGSCLTVLKNIALDPSFDCDGSVTELDNSVRELQRWLIHTPTIDIWLPTLNLRAKLTVSNLDLITISGNHSKHNLARLTGVSNTVARVLSNHGYEFDREMVPLALDDFREHLGENYFVYYSTWLAELLNNVRWGVQTYLQPTFNSSIKRKPDGTYHYEYTPLIRSEISRAWFWRLMNKVRRGPNLKRFKGARYLKEQSALEWSNKDN